MDNDLISRSRLLKELDETEIYDRYSVKVLINVQPTVEQPQGEWISVSERLPDKNGVYLVTLEYIEDSEIVNEIDMAWFVYSEKDDCNNGFHKAYIVTAWQPLPEPYKEGGKEE